MTANIIRRTPFSQHAGNTSGNLTFGFNSSTMNYMANPSKPDHGWLAIQVGAARGCTSLLDK
jgi:hypothetical protein